jgi:hypothetical protein
VKWQYAIQEHQITDRWGSKRKAEELQTFHDRLNEWGQQNWEMIGYESIPIVGGFSGSVKGYAYLVFWKRPLAG